ncbi:LuxR family transcriptional regulator, partial [Catenulispora pinisilvae]|uniref:LuxR family transcriptional regulator n=2 Tax=Catenulispora pinisilvae TaxID=2705253 RepID=UPI001E3B75CE
ATTARDRGAIPSAIELADLAIRFTPPEATTALTHRQIAAAELHYMRGDTAKACELAGAAWPVSAGADLPTRRRALALFTHTLLYTQGPAAAQRVVEAALLAELTAEPEPEPTADPSAVPGTNLVGDLARPTGDSADATAEATADATGHLTGDLPAAPTGTPISAPTPADPCLRSLALAFAADFNVAIDPPYARRCAVEAIRICDRLGAEADPAALATALLALVEIDMFAGRGVDRALVERARVAQAGQRWVPFIELAEVRFGLSIKYVDDLDTSRSVLTRMVRRAREVGETSGVAILLAHLAYTEVLAGRPGAARLALAEFEEARREAGPGIGEPASLTVARALVAIMDGDLDGGEATLIAALERLPPIPLVRVIMDTPLATIALLRGDVERAITLLTGVLEQARAVHVHEPAARGRPEGDLGQALVTAGRLEVAAAVAAELAELGARLERPTLSGIALRIQGMIAAARGELDVAAEALTRAVQAHAASPMPIERGRSLLALGQVQRRRKAKPEARQALQDALDCFTEHGHRPFAQLAEAELDRGQRAAAGSLLTASEQRVADLVADGFTNREVAARLSMSVRTVESHVGSVFRKLGVRSRTELAGRFKQ